MTWISTGSPAVLTSRPDRVRHQRGFSLLEVLVAFVVLVLVVSVLFQIFGGALRNASTAEDYSRALLIAESRMAAVGVEKPLREGTDSGSEYSGQYAWQTNIAPYIAPDSDAQADAANPVLGTKVVQADVTVSWGPIVRPLSLTLTTLRVMAKEAQ
jgi:general secretion pathway protein I